MRKILFILLFVIAITTKKSIAQISPNEIKARMNEIDSFCQNCIDAGTNNFVDCETIRHNKIDSILNAVYKELKKEMDTGKFSEFKKEQRLWLKKKDANYASYAVEMRKSDAGVEADQAMTINNDSNFIEQRIIYLLKKLKQ